MFRISDNVSQAAINAFAGRMRPAGREFETPEVECNTFPFFTVLLVLVMTQYVENIDISFSISMYHTKN